MAKSIMIDSAPKTSIWNWSNKLRKSKAITKFRIIDFRAPRGNSLKSMKLWKCLWFDLMAWTMKLIILKSTWNKKLAFRTYTANWSTKLRLRKSNKSNLVLFSSMNMWPRSQEYLRTVKTMILPTSCCRKISKTCMISLLLWKVIWPAARIPCLRLK